MVSEDPFSYQNEPVTSPVISSISSPFDSDYVSFGYSAIWDGNEQAESVVIPIPAGNTIEINWYDIQSGSGYHGQFISSYWP